MAYKQIIYDVTQFERVGIERAKKRWLQIGSKSCALYLRENKKDPLDVHVIAFFGGSFPTRKHPEYRYTVIDRET